MGDRGRNVNPDSRDESARSEASIVAAFRQAAQPHLALRVLERAVTPHTLAGLAEGTGRLPERRSAVKWPPHACRSCRNRPRSSSAR